MCMYISYQYCRPFRFSVHTKNRIYLFRTHELNYGANISANS